MTKKDNVEILFHRVVELIENMGYPKRFGILIAESLGTEMTLKRMAAYLSHGNPGRPEDIADEMLAICDDRDRMIRKKQAEYYNARYNEILNKQ